MQLEQILDVAEQRTTDARTAFDAGAHGTALNELDLLAEDLNNALAPQPEAKPEPAKPDSDTD